MFDFSLSQYCLGYFESLEISNEFCDEKWKQFETEIITEFDMKLKEFYTEFYDETKNEFPFIEINMQEEIDLEKEPTNVVKNIWEIIEKEIVKESSEEMNFTNKYKGMIRMFAEESTESFIFDNLYSNDENTMKDIVDVYTLFLLSFKHHTFTKIEKKCEEKK